jgi:hypothetical protein
MKQHRAVAAAGEADGDAIFERGPLVAGGAGTGEAKTNMGIALFLRDQPTLCVLCRKKAHRHKDYLGLAAWPS